LAMDPTAKSRRRTAQRSRQGTVRRRIDWLPPVAALVVAGLLIVGVVAVMQGARGALPNGARPPGSGASGSAQQAPDFTLTTIDGESFQLAAQRGHAVVVYFLAPGCNSCLGGSHDVAQAVQSAQVRGAQAVMIDLNTGDQAFTLQAFADDAG